MNSFVRAGFLVNENNRWFLKYVTYVKNKNQ